MGFEARHSYNTRNGVPVFYAPAVNKRPRKVPLDKLPLNRSIYLIAHFTESETLDSREYLRAPSDGRVVSTHYLAGEYPEMNWGAPAVIKYASETLEATYTQGFGVIGDLATYDHGADWNDNLLSVRIEINANDACIGYEIEANPSLPGTPSEKLLVAVCSHMAEIINYWDNLGREVVLLGHKHIDPHKADPELNWSSFVKRVYGFVR